MHRYEITTSADVHPGDAYLLRQALARVAPSWDHMVSAIEVSSPGGGLLVAMDVVARRARAKVECERLFAAAWYDAFGSYTDAHVGRFSERPNMRHPQVLTA